MTLKKPIHGFFSRALAEVNSARAHGLLDAESRNSAIRPWIAYQVASFGNLIRIIALLFVFFLSPHLGHGYLSAAGTGAQEGTGFALPGVFGDDGCDLSKASLQGLDNARADLSGLHDKVVLVHFWATWCEPCKEEFPALMRLYERNKSRGLEILAISLDTPEKTREFIKTNRIALPVVLDKYGELKRNCKASVIPYSVVLGRDKSLKARIVGQREYDSHEALVFFERFLR